MARVSNTAQQAELSLRQSIARECAADSCALCTATTRHEEEGQSGTMPYPCEVVQAQIKLAEHDFYKFLANISEPVHGRGEGCAYGESTADVH